MNKLLFVILLISISITDAQVISPDLQVDITCSNRRIFLNKHITFTITIHNKGSGDAINVNVVNALPLQVEYISATPNGVYTPPKGKHNTCDPYYGDNLRALVKWHFQKIKSHETVVLKIVARGINGTQVCRNTLTVSMKRQKIFNEIKIRVAGGIRVHLSTYETEDPIKIGENTTYVIKIENYVCVLTNATLVNTIPKNMEFIKASGEYEYNSKKHSVKYTLPSVINPGDKYIFKIVCRAAKAGNCKNVARFYYKYRDTSYNPPMCIDEESTAIYQSPK